MRYFSKAHCAVFALVVASLIIVSCSKGGGGNDDPTPPTPPAPSGKQELTLTGDCTRGLTYASEGGEQEITFTSTHSWTASISSNTASWCKLGSISGQAGSIRIPVTISANETYDERNSTVTITSGSLRRTVVVTQKQRDALLVSSSKVEIPTNGGEFTIKVSANITYTYTIPEQFKSWISTVSGSRALTTKELTFKAAPNDDSSSREGYIIFSGGGLEEKVNVYQTGGSVLIISEKAKNMPAAGGTFTVELTSNCEFNVQTPTVNWIRQDMSRALSSHTLHFIVDPYESAEAPRKGEVKFVSADGSVSETVTVTQYEKSALVLAENELEVPAAGGSVRVEYSTNREVICEIPSAEAGWIKAFDQKTSRAMTTGEQWFEIAANTAMQPRSANVRFYLAEDPTVEKTVTFHQGKREFSVTSDMPEGGFNDARSHAINVRVESNIGYNVELPANITDITPAGSGKGNHTFLISPNLDQSTDVKRSEIRFMAGEVLLGRIDISQKKPEARLTADELNVSATGGIFEIPVETNTDIEITIPKSAENWISLTEPTDDGKLPTLNINPNASISGRTANITVKAGSILNADLKISQSGGEFKVSTDVEDNRFLDAYSHTFHASVKSTVDYNVVLPENISDITPENMPEGEYTFLIGPNHDTQSSTKLSQIRFVNGDVLLGSVYISQAPPRAVIRQDELRVSTSGGSFAIPVETNTDIAVGIPDHAQSWISTSGQTDGETVTQLIVSPNPSPSARTAKITLTAGTFFNSAFTLIQSGTIPEPDLNVNTVPGKLLDEIGPNAMTISSIRINGEIGASDIESLKNLVVQGQLRTIDLSDVTIKAGSGTYTAFGLQHSLNEDNTIGAYMFKDIKIEHILLPKNLRKIEREAFSNCRLTEIVIPEGVSELGQSVFRSNGHLTSAVIPSTLDSIPASTFETCLALSDVKISEGPQSIGAMAFGYLNASYNSPAGALSSIKLPKTMKRIAHSAFFGSSIEEIELHENISEIGASAFERCLNLRKVVMKCAPADGRINDNTFYNDTRLKELHLPEGITTIGRASLAYVGVTDLTFPSTLKIIEDYALNQADCRTVKLPEGLHTIGAGGMSQMPWLRSLDLPSTLVNIGRQAFSSSYYSLKEIHCRMTTPPDVDTSIFSSALSRKTPLYVPKGCKKAYQAAPVWGEFTNIIEE